MTVTNSTYITFAESPFIQKGWVCPKCGRVFAPSVTECQYCNKSSIHSAGQFDTAGDPIPQK